MHDFIDALRRLWKTSDPQYLTPTVELTFLGVSIRMTPEGLLLHQHHYTNDLLNEHSSHITARKRLTSGEPDRFKKDDPLPPDATNPDHQEWVKRGQRILGGFLWLSTRTRPDLAFAVSPAAQVLTKNLELLKVKLRHILQYLNTTRTLGLRYPYPRKRDLMEFTVFGDSSFAPSGKHSQSGFTIHLSFGNVRHLIHWQSQREQKIAESSAESELYALDFARKSARNFRLLIRESFATSIIMGSRCDNTAAISMLDEPGWRTRYISIYGESARQELLNRTMVLTYVSTDRRLADPMSLAMTKPTTALVNSLIFPQWGLVSLPDGRCLQSLDAILLTLRGSFATTTLIEFCINYAHCSFATMTFIELCQTDSYLSHSDSRPLLLTLRGSFASTSFANSCCNALSNLLSTTLLELCPPRATTLPTTGYHF